MRGPQIIRVAMVVVFVAVLVSVAMMWRERADDPGVDVPEPPDTAPGVVSLTLEPRYTAQVNGILLYEVEAGRGVAYEGNRSEYDGGVRLRLYSTPTVEGGVQEVTTVTSQRLELVERDVPVEGDAYESVRLFDDVVATLPNGAEFRSDVLTYRDGELYTNRGVRMRAGGLMVESRNMRYRPDDGTAELRQMHPQTERPLMRGPVKLWSQPVGDAATAALDIEGSANALLYDVAGAIITLQGAPTVVLPEAQVIGQFITMTLTEEGGSITGIEASGGARAQWWRGDSGEADSMESEIIAVAVQDGEPQGLTAWVEAADAPRPLVSLADGTLRADVIDLGFAGDAGAGMTARGQAYFFPTAPEGGLQHIGADELALASGDLGDLLANGNVEIKLSAAAAGGSTTFTGPRARFAYRDGAIAAADWPQGLSYADEAAALQMTAGHGALDADSGDWVLRDAAEGAPPQPSRRPRLQGREIDVGADVIRLAAAGDVALSGAVDARLSGDVVRTVGPLFGNADVVQAAADELRLRRDSERLDFSGNARVWRAGGEQMLRADEIDLQPQINDLQARGNVFVNLVDPADPQRGRDAARIVVLTGRQLLVAGSPLQLIMAGQALLEIEDTGRRIGGERIEVSLTDAGVWDSLQVHDKVVMTDPAGTGEGARLEYSADTGVVVIYAAEGGQATFIPQQGIDIRDRQGLRLEWEGDNLKVTAMQNGTTQTLRGGGQR